jgi:hypothetical protein
MQWALPCWLPRLSEYVHSVGTDAASALGTWCTIRWRATNSFSLISRTQLSTCRFGRYQALAEQSRPAPEAQSNGTHVGSVPTR